jgi:hypothetical protein
MTSVYAAATAAWASIVALVAEAVNVPGSALMTGAAAVGGLVAIGYMVRSIARTETQSARLVEELHEELTKAHEEIKELHAILRREL